MKNPFRMDPGDPLRGLPAPCQPLLDQRGWFAGFKQIFGHGTVRCAFKVDTRAGKAFEADDAVMWLNNFEHLSLDFEPGHVSAGRQWILEDG